MVGVHRDDRYFERIRCFGCRDNGFPVGVGDSFDVEVLNRSRGFRMYWKIFDMWLPKSGPALISQAITPFR